jgi:hypothetical protein
MRDLLHFGKRSLLMRVAFLAVVSGVAVVGLCGCHGSLDGGRTTISPKVLFNAATETQARYIRAVNAGDEVRSDVIPERYWADAIRRLKPLKVYTHRANVVVVQRVRENVEEGKYICTPISSFLPQPGVDDFSITPNPQSGDAYHVGNGVFDYQRWTDVPGADGPTP